MSAHRAKWLAGMVSTAVVFTACGSDTPVRKVAASRVVSTAPAPHVDPCGPAPPGASTGGSSVGLGVTKTSISVGVVADASGGQSQFTPNWQAVQAFAAYCNSVGGIAGRRLDVRLFDTKTFNHRSAIADSCASVFALVGSAAAFDGDGSDIESDCGIPDIPALVAEPAHAQVPTLVAPLPEPQNMYLVGPERYLARRFPEAVRRAGVAYLDVAVTALRASRHVAGTTDVGFRYVSVNAIPALYSTNGLDALIARLHTDSVGYLSVHGRFSDLANVQRALADHGDHVAVVDAGPLFYDSRYLTAVGAAGEGTYVVTQTTPFTDAAKTPELRRYIDWLTRTVPGAMPTAQGTRSWSAALLFAEAARRASTNLDRSSLLAELRAVHAWDGNGIQAPADPGAGKTSSCFAYVQVRSGAFRRAYPSTGFSCPSDGWIRLRPDFRHF